MAKVLRIVSCEAVEQVLEGSLAREPSCHRGLKIVASKLDSKRR
jgi:hypothetical protein